MLRYCSLKATRLAKLADVIGAISLDAYDGRIEPFHPSVHAVRPHPGQAVVAGHFRDCSRAAQLIKRRKEHVQDPYSFRCIPQVHGASAMPSPMWSGWWSANWNR
jgi:histidine ammonia-lyase